VRLEQAKRMRPLTSQSNNTPFLWIAPGLRYVLGKDEVQWSEAPIYGYKTFGSAIYNNRLRIISGTLHEDLGGNFVWHFTQKYPSAIPQQAFAHPTNTCAPKS
jgi:hypothetical protein